MYTYIYIYMYTWFFVCMYMYMHVCGFLPFGDSAEDTARCAALRAPDVFGRGSCQKSGFESKRILNVEGVFSQCTV